MIGLIVNYLKDVSLRAVLGQGLLKVRSRSAENLKSGHRAVMVKMVLTQKTIISELQQTVNQLKAKRVSL